MIAKVTIKKFKKFKNATFELKPRGLTLLAGGNNSGKSTLLHALAVWQFCCEVWEEERGRASFNAGPAAKKVLLRPDEFYPVSVPALNHLWHNVRPSPQGRDLSLSVEWLWTPPSSEAVPQPTTQNHRLRFSLSLHHDRIHLQLTETTLNDQVMIPRITFLPSFAGMREREPRMNPPERARLIGAGMPGGTLRNMLQDLYDTNQKGWANLRKTSPIDPKERSAFLDKDGWEQLQSVINEVFHGDSGKIELQVRAYKPLIHTALKVETARAYLWKGRIKALADVPPRDLMVEGAGFLQWLSVYALLVNPALDVVLLDEPDAHLHATLQSYLLSRLQQHTARYNKQVLLATHSTTVLSEVDSSLVLRVESAKYLKDDTERQVLFEGIGSVFCPIIDRLKKYPSLFIYEGPSDLELLKIFAAKLGLSWPSNLVYREMKKKKREEREAIFAIYKKEIPALRGLSMEDSDGYDFGQTRDDLTYDNLVPFRKDLGLRMWRRRNIENYLLVKRAIVEASGRTENDVNNAFEANGVPLTAFPAESNCVRAWALLDGKFVTSKSDNLNNFSTLLGCDIYAIARKMKVEEVSDDIKTFIQELVNFAK
jgi:ABC-type cobalamin/Fe3+-siderophores transport system ATPase subunit